MGEESFDDEVPAGGDAEASEGGRPRGRPRDPARLERVLDAARLQFLEHGFDRASMDAIAEAAGISKVTVYSYFPSKEALYQATITAKVSQLFQLEGVGTLDPKDPAGALTFIGRSFLRLIRNEDVVAHHRVLFGNATRNTEVGQLFFEAGPAAVCRAVAGYLARATAAGSLQVADPERAADEFLALFHGCGNIRALLALNAPDGAAEAERQIASAVRLFVRGYAPEG